MTLFFMDDLGFVHRYVPAEKGSNRMLLLPHWTGADESELLPIGRAVDENAALLQSTRKGLGECRASTSRTINRRTLPLSQRPVSYPRLIRLLCRLPAPL